MGQDLEWVLRSSPVNINARIIPIHSVICHNFFVIVATDVFV
jgi:hypothetical protein